MTEYLRDRPENGHSPFGSLSYLSCDQSQTDQRTYWTGS